MTKDEYFAKVITYARASEIAQNQFKEFLESISHISSTDLTSEQWEEHDKLLNEVNTSALGWVEFCAKYRSGNH